MQDVDRLSTERVPEFGRYYYAHDCGRPYERNEYWLAFFHQMARRIVEDLEPKTVLDAGCAMGILVECLRGLGVEAWGVDVSKYAIDSVHSSVKEYCHQASLAESLPGSVPSHFDLVTCIEVVEHMPPDETDTAIDNLCGVSDRVLFSSSPHDYAEATHVNVRPHEEWGALFARRGFLRNLDINPTFVTPWAVLYERASMPIPELVRTYERILWRYKDAAQQARETVLDLQSRLEAGADQEEVARLQDEVVLLKQELLASRDVVIGSEARLAESIGRIAALEADLERYRQLSARVDRVVRSPLYRYVIAPLRAARRKLR